MTSQITDEAMSPIIWPSRLAADRDMNYESLDLLYEQPSNGKFGDEMAFIVSCSRQFNLKKNDPRGVLQKIDVETMPDFKQAKIEVTHEVLPGLGASTQIISVNPKLKVACFDQGSIIPISNFGYKKTFHSDVRGRLSHHSGQITCLASNADGTKLASGCSAGGVTFYQVREAAISFTTRTTEAESNFITAMAFLKNEPGFSFGPPDAVPVNENLLIYANDLGQVYLMDSRCRIAEPPVDEELFSTEPPRSITSLCPIRSQPGHIVYFGDVDGRLFAHDLRNGSQPIHSNKDSTDGAILRMKSIIVKEDGIPKEFLAYSNSTRRIKIIDLETLNAHPGWSCDRLPDGNVKDLIQVNDRIVTCGTRTSIGCWKWIDPSTNPS